MSPVSLFILLTLLALLLLTAEIFVPGGVLGSIGGVCMLVACGFAIAAFGLSSGLMVSMLLILATLGGVLFWLLKMPDTRVGKRVALSTVLSSEPKAPSRVGQQGIAETDLRPGGFARFEGKKTDVIAVSGYIEKGSEVEIVSDTGSQVQVRLAVKESV